MQKIKLAVIGTLMRGLDLNGNLIEAGAEFLRETKTARAYRMWSIDGKYPAMQKVTAGGASLTVEVWELTNDALIDVLRKEPPGLCIGLILLKDGDQVLGVLGEAWICEGKEEITAHGGWREYVSS
ncbi:MAG: glutamyl-tRNA amidotransferase [Planctomycetota bacterium]|jgi:gamma-glutamylcyclotransferase (GGCT)/AIG2-like uncharacterized protein YtfP|nr:glutamyl-tRNA amidotransferase [Planctomycetota bacterium]